MLPDFILERGKQGYSLPIKNWLRDGSARLHGRDAQINRRSFASTSIIAFVNLSSSSISAAPTTTTTCCGP